MAPSPENVVFARSQLSCPLCRAEIFCGRACSGLRFKRSLARFSTGNCGNGLRRQVRRPPIDRIPTRTAKSLAWQLFYRARWNICHHAPADRFPVVCLSRTPEKEPSCALPLENHSEVVAATIRGPASFAVKIARVNMVRRLLLTTTNSAGRHRSDRRLAIANAYCGSVAIRSNTFAPADLQSAPCGAGRRTGRERQGEL